MKVISSFNHGSSKVERQIKTISEIIVKHLWDKGQMWPLFAMTVAHAINVFASEALNGFSPFELSFLVKSPDLVYPSPKFIQFQLITENTITY